MQNKIKIASASDIHIRETKPKNRVDNFIVTQYRKYKQMLRLASVEKVSFFGFAGDVFDTPHISYEFVANYIECTKLHANYTIGTVFGQHDLRYHSLKQSQNTPLYVLLKGIDGVVLNDDGYYINDFICIKGCSWGESIPEIDKDCINVLFIHDMIIKDDTLFEGQESYKRGKNLLVNTGYDLIISGDNHAQFTVEYKNKLLINNGSMMRQNIGQLNHIPRISIIELDENGIVDFKWKDLKIKPFDEVFRNIPSNDNDDKEDIEKDKRLIGLNEFFSKIQNSDESRIDFVDKLYKSKEVAPEYVQKWIDVVLESLANENKLVNK